MPNERESGAFAVERKWIIPAVSAAVAAALALSFGFYAGREVKRDDFSVSYSRRAPAPSPLLRSMPELIDINSADEEELCTLDGIGPALAGRIIEYREEHGGFERPADIMNVQGIGEGIYSKIKDLVTAD